MTHTYLQLDATGIHHFDDRDGKLTSVRSAAKEALNITGHPHQPTIFWWNETPSPVEFGDNVRSLVSRWIRWHRIMQNVDGIPATRELEKLFKQL